MKTIAEAETFLGKYVNIEAVDPATGHWEAMGGVLVAIEDEGDDAWAVVDYGYGMSLRYISVLEEDEPEQLT